MGFFCFSPFLYNSTKWNENFKIVKDFLGYCPDFSVSLIATLPYTLLLCRLLSLCHRLYSSLSLSTEYNYGFKRTPWKNDENTFNQNEPRTTKLKIYALFFHTKIIMKLSKRKIVPFSISFPLGFCWHFYLLSSHCGRENQIGGKWED